MNQYHEETLLILTKTYPSPSAKYRETTCVAAINSAKEIRRLFPVPFRLLSGASQFHKWQWIKARITKAKNDHRPESYKIDTDSIELMNQVDTKNNWADRICWIQDLIVSNIAELDSLRVSRNTTIGFIKPDSIKLIITKSKQLEWTKGEVEKLVKEGLFDTAGVQNRKILEKIPYDFYYEYSYDTGTGILTSKHKLIDWEVCELYRNCRNKYGNNWEEYFREKLEKEFSQKDLIFIMGNMKRFPTKWLVVGLIYPPKVSARQLQLLSSAPDA